MKHQGRIWSTTGPIGYWEFLKVHKKKEPKCQWRCRLGPKTMPYLNSSRVNYPDLNNLFDNICQFWIFQFWSCPHCRGVTPNFWDMWVTKYAPVSIICELISFFSVGVLNFEKMSFELCFCEGMDSRFGSTSLNNVIPSFLWRMCRRTKSHLLLIRDRQPLWFQSFSALLPLLYYPFWRV